MTDVDRIEHRLAAVERALVDGESTLEDLSDLEAVVDRIERLESRLDEHERRLGTVQGTFQALEGFVGNVRSVNDDVERRADAAVATVDRLERRLDRLERRVSESGTDDGLARIGDTNAARSSDSPSTSNTNGSDEPTETFSSRPPFAICSSSPNDRTDRAEATAAELFADTNLEPAGDGDGSPKTAGHSAESGMTDEPRPESETGGERESDDRSGDPFRGILHALFAKLP